jgi:hypothetical protein
MRWPSDPLPLTLILAGGLLGLYASFSVRVLLHELAHAVVGRLLGMRILGILIGSGPLLLRLPAFDGSFELRLLPRHGLVRAASLSARGFRARSIAFLLAGPVMDLMLVAGLWGVSLALVRHRAVVDQQAPLPVFLSLTAIVQSLTVLSSLLTRRIESLDVTGDLFKLAAIARMDERAVELAVGMQRMNLASQLAWQQFVAGDVGAGLQIWDASIRPHDHAILLGRSLFVWAIDGAAAALQAIAEERAWLQRFTAANAEAGSKDGRRWQATLDALHINIDTNEAFFAVQTDHSDLLPHAAMLMQRAMATRPREPGVVRTLGLVQVHQGQLERGLANLEWAWRQSEPRWLRALCACYLAYAHALLGDQAKARGLLAAARGLDRRCLLLPKYTALAAAAAQST